MALRAALASPLGFLIGVSLGALGGGGSILAVPVLVYAAGLSATAATSTSLVVVGVASVIGAVGHARAGRVRIKAGVLFGLVGVGGSIAGSALNRRLDGDALLLAFAALILVAAWRIVTGCPSCTQAGEDDAIAGDDAPEGDGAGGGGLVLDVRHGARSALDLAKLAAVGTGVGFLTGLFGVGGGFVIVPTLALVLRYSMPFAIGTSLVVIAVNTAVAFAARLGTNAIDWPTTALFTAAAIAGVVAGKRVADRLDAQSLQRWFAMLLVLVAAYTGIRSGMALL